ncbi:hypothetical protein L1887_03537 [Cichorium endivia]|nr:hypothetical protein L1887_03537 [Cichorium endivia]
MFDTMSKARVHGCVFCDAAFHRRLALLTGVFRPPDGGPLPAYHRRSAVKLSFSYLTYLLNGRQQTWDRNLVLLLGKRHLHCKLGIKIWSFYWGLQTCRSTCGKLFKILRSLHLQVLIKVYLMKPAAVSSTPSPALLPSFHTSELGPWCAVISYEACVRLCLKNWSIGSSEARAFLKNECSLLRTAFCLDQFILQPEAELLSKRSSELVVMYSDKNYYELYVPRFFMAATATSLVGKSQA